MKRFSAALCLQALALALILTLRAAPVLAADPVVALETSKGNVLIQLFEEQAPLTVANFLRYVDSGFYNGTLFHRVIKGFVVQGGGMDVAFMEKRSTFPPIHNESTNGLRNTRGTLSMARTGDPDSATSQFFINLVDNASLDAVPGATPQQPRRWGYAVFGKVIRGMDAVDAMALTPTTSRGPYRDVPSKDIYIKRAYRYGK